MSPIENYNHVLLLSIAVWAARALQCLDRAGLLDDDSRASIHRQLALLSEAAEKVPPEEPILTHLDMLVHLLPPPPSESQQR